MTHLTDIAGKDHAYICCSCGPSEISAEHLRRWEFDTPQFLATLFQTISLSTEERVAGHLWKVGRATWAGRAREVWFVRSFQRSASTAVVDSLKSHPKAILFVPTETSVLQWQKILPQLIVSLESTIALNGAVLQFDAELVESRIPDSSLVTGAPRAKKPQPLRALRASKIEKITTYMNDHLRAARDHAWETKERTGLPQLLPRPSQIELAKMLGISETDVSRCLDDHRAKELKICWVMAADLDRVMRWVGPRSRKKHKRKTKDESASRKRDGSDS